MTKEMRLNVYAPFHLLRNVEKIALIWVNSPAQNPPPKAILQLWNQSRLRYCTDGAANVIMQFCKSGETKPPQAIVGDFDSVSTAARDYFAGDSKFTHLHDQNSTDLTKTLNLVDKTIEADALDVRAIVLFGGLHGRFDHVLSTLNTMLLHQTSGSDLPVFVIDGENIVTVLREGTTKIVLDPGMITGVCGIIPICQRETRVTTSGFRWDLEDRLLNFGGLVSSSNKVSDENRLEVHARTAPVVFTFELKSLELIF